MIIVAFFLIGLTLIILQTTVFMPHPVWIFSPDLYYILVAFLAYRMDPVRSLLVLFPLSWVLDVFAGTILGTFPAICIIGYIFLHMLNLKLPVRASLYQVPLVGVSFLFVTWLVHLALDFFEPGAALGWSWPQSIVRAVMIVVFTFPLFRFFEWLLGHMSKPSSGFSLFRVKGGNRRRGAV
jgi:rod shape-determining protein MreD